MLDREEMARWERLTAAMLATAATDDPEGFAQVVTVLDRAQQLLPAVAAELRGEPHEAGDRIQRTYSWGDLAGALGVTRSAVAQRFGMNRVPALAQAGDAPAHRRWRDYLARERTAVRAG